MFHGVYDPNRITLSGLLHPGDGVMFNCPFEDSLSTRRITVEGVGKNIALLKGELEALSGKESLAVPRGIWSKLYPLERPGYILYFDSDDPVSTGIRLLDTVLLRDLIKLRNLSFFSRPRLAVYHENRLVFEKHINVEPNKNGRVILPSIVF